ncbi:T-cell immunoglobulin and mucin domain-containing protein 4 [Fundulus heteroclitus]|uniref:T-cell immunoglobulin and mucin domain-containing protein 4 n=1 Tax=Fundulus heteroclitus TaxID=8078 RepID=UPI00165CDCFB|nr:T-cell immunoglobulin and mucin domain-containing protein 4 [Fundulus heteroclitus]
MVIQYPAHMFVLPIPFLLILIQVSSCTIKVTGYIGQDVTLPCAYDAQSNGVLSFCWGLGRVPRSKCADTILSSEYGEVTYRESSRYQLLSQVEQGNVSLTILNAQRSDAGIYGCRVEIPGLFNDQKSNINLIMEEERVISHEMEATDATVTTPQSPTSPINLVNDEHSKYVRSSQGNFKAFLGEENIGRIAAIFLFTIILILILIFRRNVLMRRTKPLQLHTCTVVENMYDTIPMAK